MAIHWTEETRKTLLARDFENAAKPRLPKREKAWAEIRARMKPRGTFDPIAANFVTHRGQATPENAKLTEVAELLIRSETPPTIDDVDVAAALITLLTYLANRRTVLDYVAGERGYPFAFRVALRVREFALGRPQHLVAAADSRTVDHEWRTILRGVAPEVRAECKEVARAAWERASIGVRSTLAYTFFEEPGWGDAVAKQWLADKNRPLDVLYPIVRDFGLAKELVLQRENARSFLELVETFGDAMLPILLEVGAAPKNPFDLKYAAESLALYDDERVATFLAGLVAKTKVRPYVQQFFAAHPERAEAAFAPLVKGKTKAAKVAAEFLAGATRASTTANLDEAPAGELPEILRDPPWERKKQPKRPTTVLAVDPILVPERIAWRDGERDKLLARLAVAVGGRPPATPAQLAELDTYLAGESANKRTSPWLWRNAKLPLERSLALWNDGSAQFDNGGRLIGHVIAQFGEAAIPGLVIYLSKHFADSWGDANELLAVDAPRIAPALAVLVRSKRRGVLAWRWMEKNPTSAVLGLVPVALGESDEREAAESALIRLAASGVDVVGLAAPYGREVTKALAVLVQWDPIFDCPKTVPKMGPSWRPETFSRPRLKSGKALPIAAVERIGQMLAFTPLDPPYAGLVRVAEACDEHSLAELSWDLARAWEHGGAKVKEKWMLMSLVHLADEEVTRRMTPGIRTDYAVEALAVMGTDAALMELATIAGRQNAQGEWSLSGRIETMLDTAASLRGVTKDELEEDLAPTTALDDDASLALEYGSRTLRVGFDEHLAPYVRGENGERMRGLPPARKDDDPTLVERAKLLWRDLKEDMTVIGMRRVRALERAMTDKRVWTKERFVRVWQEDRLVKHLARGVLWSTETTRFRIAEDGSLAGAGDEPLVLDELDVVHVPHPWRMAKDELAAWRQIFEDYEIVQPFPQLGRNLPDVGDLSRKTLPWAGSLARPAEAMNRLGRSGFRWTNVGGKVAYRRALPTRGELLVTYAMVNNVPTDVTIAFELDGAAVSLGEVDPIEVAEMLHELYAQ